MRLSAAQATALAEVLNRHADRGVEIRTLRDKSLLVTFDADTDYLATRDGEVLRGEGEEWIDDE